ncbi:MAG: hypothetical protein JWM95_154 [Gemmatimonadetes bacterium]|nr:hypothetical protein [Gemmatimonadota bacterium]
MIRPSRQLLSLVVLVAACHASQPPAEAPAYEVPVRPLAQLASQHVIVTPAFSVLPGDALGWSAQIPKPRDYLKTLDDEIATAFGERGLKSQWIYPPDLVRASKNNPTYAVDPYALGVNVLRSNAIASGSQLGDPLVTQMRTMIALQEGARAVLVPVELRFEKLPTGKGVAALRIALLDGRLGDVRWVGVVRSDPADSLSRVVLTSLAAHFADLITAP